MPPNSDVTWRDSSPQLTGDWWGARSVLADGGITLNADNTSFFFGNATGGSAQQLLGSGHGDYVLNFDGEKLGIADDTYLKIRAEHRYGQTVVNNVNCFISPTLLADLPVFNSDQLYLTDFLITRKLGDSFEIYAGKMDTLDGDKNDFAHARGKMQFSNMAFVFNPIVGATVPYSTLGAGMALSARWRGAGRDHDPEFHRYDQFQRLQPVVQRWDAPLSVRPAADAICRAAGASVSRRHLEQPALHQPERGIRRVPQPHDSHHPRLVGHLLELRSIPGRR